MLILGIESSCDETAAAVVRDGRYLYSNVVASQVEEHKLYGGVVPEIASRRHAEAISSVVQAALDEALVTFNDIDAIAVTYGPGLIGSLLVGVNFAKGLTMSSGKPLVPVHHLRAHLATNYVMFRDLKPPFVGLVASGGHTHLVKVEDFTSYTLLARTRDDAAGECFDKVARSMGLPYPGGVHLSKLAAQGDPTAFRLPHPKVEGSDLDFSFSGLKTAALNLIHNAKQKGQELNLADLAASFQQTVIDILCDHTLRAVRETDCKTVVMAGGVAANWPLQTAMKQRCAEAELRFCCPYPVLCGDNAVMVAAQGFFELKERRIAGIELNATPTLSIEESYPKAKRQRRG